ncbi:MAG: 2-oxoglutarate ferredoxin oxidoreductase subunit alpha [Deltaproteobacteria bacterium CG11_big_fil_rev_8_21_14_0_20_47_16]|nr:MAG: 2-oxoglutarate ferredoxin oxidoreductase subunit alpha [Deltaproteobacteria bacterium CG11_big_fil_rev_8_21_14_0_20_47_16]
MTTAGTSTSGRTRTVTPKHDVVIRFAGDSGDGMQLTGAQFTAEAAIAGNDIATFPDYPAEIRAPAGTIHGVSGYQLNFSDHEVFTAGDEPSVLVVMNPAALKANIKDLAQNGILIVDTDSFTEQNLKKVKYEANPLEDGSLDKYQLFKIDITKLTTAALNDMGLSTKEATRCKNFFCLGLVSWLFHRPTEITIQHIEKKFKNKPGLAEANRRAFMAGYNYADTTELFAESYEVKSAPITAGTYRNITGNAATALGFVAAAQRAGRPLFLGSYPITPASDVLHELSKYKALDVVTYQAEDEIAGIGSAIGAAFGGAIGITTTSGPGLDLKAEALGLAAKVELPLVVADIQRAGPSTGLPTKTEQSDLLLAMFGRHGESPLPVIAAASPADCFMCAYTAVRIAVKYMTPVILLTDGYIANGSEPWKLPEVDQLPDITVKFATDAATYKPYSRDEKTLARPWAIPGTPGLEHRLGGLEGQNGSGNISSDPDNHELMTKLRAEKVQRIAQEIPPMRVMGPKSGDAIVVGWGSTFGPIHAAVKQLQKEGRSVAHSHISYINPLPSDLGDLLKNYKKVIIPEMNMGQLRMLIRANFLVDAIGINKMKGKPFTISELVTKISAIMDGRKLEAVQ